MRENNTALSSVEQGPEVVSASLKSPATEALAIDSVESRAVFFDPAALLDSLSAGQLIAVLGLIGVLVIVATWYLDGIGHRIEREIYWRKTWWGRKWKSVKRLFRVRSNPRKLELSGGAGSSALDASRIESFGDNDNLTARTDQSKKLQTALDETASNAKQLAASLEKSNGRCQELNHELTDLKRVEQNARASLVDAAKEIESLRLKASRSEEDLQRVTAEARGNADLADRLEEECALLKSSFQEIENQSAEKEVEATGRLQEQVEIQNRLQEKINRLTLAAKESESKIAERDRQVVLLKEEVAGLNAQVVEQAEDARRKLEEVLAAFSDEQTLHNRLKDTVAEDLEELPSQASRLREQESEIDSLTEQLADQRAKSEQELGSGLAMLEQEKAAFANFKEDTRKRQEEERASFLNQMKTLKEDLDDRATQIDKLEKSLAKAAGDAQLQAAALEESNARCHEVTHELATWKQVGDNARSEFADATKELEALRLKATRAEEELQTAAEEARGNADLANRLREECAVLKSSLEHAENQLGEKEATILGHAKAEEELHSQLLATREMLEREKACIAETEESARARDDEMNVLVAKNADLESSLESIEQRSEEAEREFAETLERLKDEQELRAKTRQELEASERRVGELEKEVEATSITAEEHNKLVRKLVGYRKAYRDSKAVIKGLAVQKSEMSDLATEYLAMAKTIRHELDEERENNLRLTSELEKANGFEVNFDDPEVKRQVDRLAGEFVLDLKSQFERKLKKKNELIRELQSQRAHAPSNH